MARSTEELERDVRRVINLSHLLNYDVADGQFVPSTTPRPADYPKVPQGTQIFWHLMVQHPADYIAECLQHPTRMVALHAEAAGLAAGLSELESRDVLVGITLNPRTQPRDVLELIERADFVQIMTIEPGAQGKRFQPELLVKVDQVRAIKSEAVVVIDGGANSGTIETITRHSPDYVAIGSALVRAEDAAEEWQTLNRLADVTVSRG